MTPALLLANLIVCAAAFVQASVGIGFAMIAVPLLVLIDLTYAPGPALFVMLFLSITMVARAWHNIDRQGFATLFPGLAIGTIAGTFLLGVLSPSAFGLVFGGLVLAAILVGQAGFAPHLSRAVFGAGGFAAGLMGTLSGMHGPPLAVLYQRAEPARTRATIALVFVIGSVMSLVSLHFGNLFGRSELMAGVSLLPGLAVGYGLAQMGRKVISDAFARNLMVGVAGVSAVALIAKSVL